MKRLITILAFIFLLDYVAATRNSRIKRQLPNANGMLCFGCRSIIAQFLMSVNRTNSGTVTINGQLFNKAKTDLVNVCKSLKILHTSACDKIIPQFQEEVLYVLERLQVTDDDICGLFLDECGSQRLLNEFVPLNIPQMTNEHRNFKLEYATHTVRPMRVLQLADIHVDFEYQIGSEANCLPNKFCCRSYPGDNTTVINQPAGLWGTLAPCDIPYRTLLSALEHIRSNEAEIDLVLISGDFISHDLWDYSVERTEAQVRNITETIRLMLQAPIYLAIGNHEGNPQDAFMTHNQEKYNKFGPASLYATFADAMRRELKSNFQERQNVQYRGSYAVRITDGLKLISLNNAYCSKFNIFGYLNQTDPDDSLSWLTKELLDSELQGERVWLLSHIAPNDDYCVKKWTWNYYNIIKRFQNTVAQQFFGHTHFDELSIFLDDSAKKEERAVPFSYAWIAPSLTTWANVNPAYRIYEIDNDPRSRTRFTVANVYTVSADLSNPNQAPEWRVEYDFKEAYGLKDLSPKSLFELIKRFEQNADLFNDYLIRYYRSPSFVSTLKDADKAQILCNLKTSRSYDKSFC